MTSHSTICCARFSRGTCLGAIGLFALMVVPSMSYAFSVDEMIAAARAGNGTVVESHSSASSGGQTAASGQSVTTADVSASSHTETRINSNNSGGTVEVKVEKTENGITTQKEYTKEVMPNEDVRVNVNVEASSDGEESNTEVKVNGEAQNTDSDVHVESEVKTFFSASVPKFFKKVFSFFLWF